MLAQVRGVMFAAGEDKEYGYWVPTSVEGHTICHDCLTEVSRALGCSHVGDYLTALLAYGSDLACRVVALDE